MSGLPGVSHTDFIHLRAGGADDPIRFEPRLQTDPFTAVLTIKSDWCEYHIFISDPMVAANLYAAVGKVWELLGPAPKED